MTTLSMEQVADLAYGAGLRGDDVAMAVAIAKAESNLVVEARGDVGIQTSKWGPSIGLWQVRSLKADRGTGRERDELALYSPSHNARSMYSIRNTARGWKHWSVYTSGAYRTHLSAATAAANQRNAAGGTSAITATGAGDGEGDTGTPTVDLGMSADVIIPARDLPLNAVAPTRVETLRIEGNPGTVIDVAKYVTGGTVELTSGEASEVTLDLANVGLELYGSGQRTGIAAGYALDWGTIRHRVSVVETDHVDGINTLKVAARSAAVYWLKQPVYGRSIATKNLSPTEWLSTEITRRFLEWPQAGALRFMGQGSPRRSDIAPVEQGDGTLENAWQVATRLAKELGYWLFEAAGTVYFGQPSWLIRNATEVKVALRPGLLGDARLDAMEPPTFRKSEDTADGATMTVRLPRGRGELVRPGMRLATVGFYGTGARPDWLVTRVTWPIDAGTEPVTVEAVEPIDPKPQPPATTGTATADGTGSSTPTTAATPTGGGAPATQAGTGSAVDFVKFCQDQLGDAYVFGAEAAASNPNPSRWDCSELVEWAAARVGVKISDGAYNQWKACSRISIDQAAKTRGALLFVGDGTGSGRDAITHVAVSLGDGKMTIEARGRAYGVVNAPIAGRFDFAGLIPGMRYT